MKYITKKEIDHIVTDLMQRNLSFETRRELEQYFGESYTKTQMERIWYRYQYIRSGREMCGRKDREKDSGFAESDGGTGD